ncbi:unnamed protein product [Lasius platythorax]|uniref:Uncharacterized protein n=1 Tax=Lasius platythorax TaxID=488582 RepID=A0AAV2NPN8_9HYME
MKNNRFCEYILSINMLLAAVASYRFIDRIIEGLDERESSGTDCSDHSVASFYGIWNICKQVSPTRPHLHIWCMTLRRITRRQARPAAVRFVAATKQLFASVIRVGLSGLMPIIICENL